MKINSLRSIAIILVLILSLSSMTTALAVEPNSVPDQNTTGQETQSQPAPSDTEPWYGVEAIGNSVWWYLNPYVFAMSPHWTCEVRFQDPSSSLVITHYVDVYQPYGQASFPGTVLYAAIYPDPL